MRQCYLVAVLIFILGCGSGGGDDEEGSDVSGALGACDTLGLKIVGGEICGKFAAAPIAVIVTQDKAGEFFLCSGTLITPTQVLTAAHCFNSDIVNAGVELGGNSYGVTLAAVNRRFNPNAPSGASPYDLSVITLNGTSALKTLPLITSRSVNVGEKFTVFGYGVDENDEPGLTEDGAERLKSANMVISRKTSTTFFGDFDSTNATICSGDSGGPAVQLIGGEAGVAGVTSFNIDGCSSGSTAGFGALSNATNSDFVRRTAPGATFR